MAEPVAGAADGKALEAPLVTVGTIILAAAVVGGAVEGAGIKVPMIAGVGRQVVAGLVGTLMLLAGLSSRWLPVARQGLEAIRRWSKRRRSRRVPRPDVGVAPQASEHFVGRESELRWLHLELVRGRRVALCGMGGMGKTQLALHYVRRHRARYRQGIFWIRGEQATVLSGDLANMAEFLRLPQQKQADQELVIARVLRWLAEHDRWLMVIDNLDGEAVDLVQQRLPSELPGHVLITSQHRLPGTRMVLEPLPIEAATGLLLRRTQHPDGAAACAVADGLGRLPLALEQARAYLEQTGEQLTTYADLLETSLAKLLAEGRVANHPRSVVATWGLSFDRVATNSRAAVDLLRLCAFLSPEAIPLSLLEHSAGVLPPESELVLAIRDRMSLNRVISGLLDYSLVSRQGDRLTVHRLVQAVVRDSLSGPDRKLWASSAVRLMAAVFPRESQETANWARCQQLLPLALTAAGHAIEEGQELIKSASLLNRVGMYDQARAEFSAARPLFERALSIRELVLGPEHPDTARSLNNLAWLLQAQGDLKAARPLYQRALTIRENVLGPQHPDTATSLSSLGWLLHVQGELAAARPLCERALAIRENVLGPEHPDTAQSVSNLAQLLKAQGQLAAARPLMERALKIRENALGPHHPNTAMALYHTAALLHEQSQLPDARPHYERALAIFERVLGPEHPYTALGLFGVAGLLQDQGELTVARRLYERAIAVYERVLAPDEPSLDRANRQGSAAVDEGNSVRARPFHERALAVVEKLLGPDHPEAATIIIRVARLLLDEGEPVIALPLYERALATRERLLGPDHPDTATSLYNLGLLLHGQGELDAARRLYERALTIRERALGADHPDTTMVRSSLHASS